MEKNQILKITFTGSLWLALAVALYFQFTNGQALFVNNYFFQNNDYSRTHETVNLLYNTFHNWGFDPLLRQLLKVFKENQPMIITLYTFAVLLIGLFLLIREKLVDKGITSAFKSFFYALAFISTSVLIFKVDLIFFTAIAWLPLFILTLEYFTVRPLLNLPLLLIASFLLISSSKIFAPLILLVLLPYYLLKTLEANKFKKTIIKSSFFVLFIASFIYYFKTNPTTFPSYPIGARLLAEDFNPGASLAIFGPSLLYEFQNFQIQKVLFCFIALTILLVNLCELYVDKHSKQLHYLCLVSALFTLLLFIPKQLPTFSLLESISLFHSNLQSAGYMPILLVVLLFLALLRTIKNDENLVLVCLICLCLIPSLNFKSSEQLNTKQLQISKLNVSNFQNELVSPSAEIILKQDNTEKTSHQKKVSKNFKGIKKLTLKSNYNQSDLALITDKNDATFWSTKLAKQTGDEFIEVTFKKNKKIRGVKLLPGKYTDFPRGINISYVEDCNKNTYKPLIKEAHWSGPIFKTIRDLPYYGKEHEILITFKPKDVCKLKLEQVGSSENFEWAIGKLEFLK